MDDPFGLRRFVDAQNPIWQTVLAELSGGQKRSHWMWFVFPQIAGLGHSAMAQRYALSSKAEASAYLAHPVLGERLNSCTRLVLEVGGKSSRDIFGTPDDMKFHSSMTVFAAVAPPPNGFDDALVRYFAGERDTATLSRL